MKFELPKNLAMGPLPRTDSLPKAMRLDLRVGEASRYFKGGILEKALLSIDKATLWIIGISWLVALVAMVMAFMSVRGVADIKVKVETAKALEPIVPRIVRQPLAREQYEPLASRIKKEYPGLTYETTGRPSLRIVSNNGEEFRSWLNALGYADSLSPGVRWNLIFFCAGAECPGQGVMQADLVAETITISQAEGGAAPPPAPAAPVAPQ
jgi:hypothetical protein